MAYSQVSGAETLRNLPLVEAVQTAIASGASVQRTADSLHVGTATVRLIRDQVPTDPVRLAEFKESTIASLQSGVAKALGLYHAALDAGNVRPETLPLGIGILMTKRLELLSEVSLGVSPQPLQTANDLLNELAESVPASIPISSSPKA